MATLQRFLGMTVVLALAACGSSTGTSATDTGPSDTGDGQITPEDAQDAATTDVAGTDAVGTDAVGPDAILLDTADAPDADAATDEVYDNDATTTDVASDGDAFGPPQNCNGFGGGGSCPNGLTCWSYPCPKCGAPPQGWCLPTLANGACYDYTTCNGGACYNATPMSGIGGWCLPAVASAGKCWPNASEATADCFPGATCEGAFICPPMGACPKADSPGTCTPGAEQKGNVYLWERSGGIVSPGEKVTVTWVNNTGASIFLAGCSTYNVENSSDGTKWTDLGPTVFCVWEGNAVEVPAGAYFDALAWSAPNTFTGALNYRFHGSYGLGCTPGKPLSQAACTSTKDVTSDAFFVGAAP